MKKKVISIVIPCFNEEVNIERSYTQVKKVFAKLAKYQYEILFVDNCSTDKSAEFMQIIAKKDKNVTVVLLSRNFGGEYSSLAGMRTATGEATCILDCDLQDPPELIKNFIRKWEEGYEVVIGYRTKIEDPFIIKMARIIFYKIMKKISRIDIPVNAGTYSLVDKKVMEIINNLPEKNRFFRGLRAWVGFKTARIEYARKARKFGKTHNTLIDYIRDAERGVFGFSYVPLEIVTYFGFLLVVASFSFIALYILLFIFFGNPIPGFMTIISLIILLGGIQILAISIVGKYVLIIFEETKNRPEYIIKNIINEHKKRALSPTF